MSEWKVNMDLDAVQATEWRVPAWAIILFKAIFLSYDQKAYSFSSFEPSYSSWVIVSS